MGRKLEILVREEYRKLLAESVAEQESSIQSQVKKGLEFADKKPADLDIPVEHLDDAENAKQNLLNLMVDPLSEASDEDTSIAKRVLKKGLAEYKDYSELAKEVGWLLQFLGMGTAASTTMLGIAGAAGGVLSLFGNSPLMGAAIFGGGGVATATVGLLVAYLLGSAGKAIEDLSTGLGDESGRVRQDYKTYWREKLGALPPDTQQEVLQGLERYLVLRRQSELITMGAMYPDHRQPTEREQALNKQKSEAFKTWSKHFSLSEKWPFWESWYAEHRNLYDMSRDKLARQKMQKFQDKQAALELDTERARTAGRVALPTAGSERGRVSVPRATTGGGRVSKIDENVKRIIREEYKKLKEEISKLLNEEIHTVQSGENLGLIAKKYGTTTKAIIAANDIKPPRYIIQPGQELKIPAAAPRQDPVVPPPEEEEESWYDRISCPKGTTWRWGAMRCVDDQVIGGSGPFGIGRWGKSWEDELP